MAGSGEFLLAPINIRQVKVSFYNYVGEIFNTRPLVVVIEAACSVG